MNQLIWGRQNLQWTGHLLMYIGDIRESLVIVDRILVR